MMSLLLSFWWSREFHRCETVSDFGGADHFIAALISAKPTISSLLQAPIFSAKLNI
jgi:hypothetical protein